MSLLKFISIYCLVIVSDFFFLISYLTKVIIAVYNSMSSFVYWYLTESVY